MATPPPIFCLPELTKLELTKIAKLLLHRGETMKSENYTANVLTQSGTLASCSDGIKNVGRFLFRVEGVTTIEATITRHPTNVFQIDLNNDEGSKIKMTVSMIIVIRKTAPDLTPSSQQCMSIGQFHDVTSTLGFISLNARNVEHQTVEYGTDLACIVTLLVKLPNSTRMLIRDLTSGVASDTKIVCCGEVLNVHKSILALRSDVFKAMFDSNNNTEETKLGVVKINDIDPVSMKTLIHFIYTGQVTMESATMDVLFAADKYNVKELVDQCEFGILANITLDNAVKIMVTSRLLASQKIFNKAQELIKSNPGQVKGGKHWEELKAADPMLAFEIIETCMFKQSNT
jgi:hypothetical protein